jgi:hypothetical protein
LECAAGHRWFATPARIRQRFGRPVCPAKRFGETRRSPLADLQRVAEVNGPRCRREQYVDDATPLSFERVNGHR